MEKIYKQSCYEKTGEDILLLPCRHEESLEMVYVKQGKVSFQTSMTNYTLEAGDFVFFPTNFVRIAKAKEGKASITVIEFPKTIFDGFSESIERDFFFMFLLQSRTKNAKITPDTDYYSEIRACFESCVDEFYTKDLCYSLRMRSELLHMMSLILLSYGSQREKDRMVYHNVMRLKPTIDYIDEHFKEHIGVNELSEVVSLTPNYFTTLFKDSIGMTTIDYIQAIRVNYEMIQLLETHKSISEIAEEVDFTKKYLSETFKEILGITPIEFKRKYGLKTK